MSSMFNGAAAFNGDLNNWVVSAVTTMSSMFNGAAAFNGDLNNWVVSAVTDMSFMFFRAAAFNGDLSNWNVSAVTRTNRMFMSASAIACLNLPPVCSVPAGGCNSGQCIMPCTLSGATALAAACQCNTSKCNTSKFCWTDNTCNDAAAPTASAPTLEATVDKLGDIGRKKELLGSALGLIFAGGLFVVWRICQKNSKPDTSKGGIELARAKAAAASV
jgi:surface protein